MVGILGIQGSRKWSAETEWNRVDGLRRKHGTQTGMAETMDCKGVKEGQIIRTSFERPIHFSCHKNSRKIIMTIQCKSKFKKRSPTYDICLIESHHTHNVTSFVTLERMAKLF